MAQQVTLDFSELGLLNIRASVGGLSTDVIHLRNISSMGPMNVTFTSPATSRPDATQVHIAIQGRPGGKDLDIQDITSPVYADTQELIDDITANIALMYAGGGGGGVASVLADAPLDSSGGANPTISIDLTGASDGDVLTVDTGAAVWAPGGGTPTTVNGQGPGAVVLQIPLDIPYFNVATGATPTAGQAKANNVDYTIATQLIFHETDGDAYSTPRGAFFADMRIGGLICIKQIDAGNTYTQLPMLVYRITSVPVLAASLYTIGVAYQSGSVPTAQPFWYVSYAGNEQTQYYNGTAVQLQEAIITGVTDGSGRLAIDMSGAPYAWTNIRAVVYSGEDGASQGAYTTLSANTGRIQFLDPVGDPSGSGIAVTAILKGI
jgi:hypothetical protein